MGHKFAELAFTPRVRELQSIAGSRSGYAAFDGGDDYNHVLTERESSFIAERDSFYMASVSETGWPYIQHRGGPAGFMKVIDDQRIGFADYSGNRQYVSAGNFMHDNRVALFFMDYPNRRRLKLLGRVRIVGPEDRTTLAALEDDDYLATVERGLVVHVEAFDWNCPQHITPRFTESEVRNLVMLARRSEVQSEPGLVSRRPAPDMPEPAATATGDVIGDGPLELVISGVRQLAPRVRSYELRSPDGGDLPVVEPGSHLRVPVRLANGQVVDRQYSIASNPSHRDHYEIAVLREAEGRGGSLGIHEQFALGTRLAADMPANQFSLHEDDRPAVLIAGGIGITPIRSMAISLAAAGRQFEFHYAGRERRDMAFLQELEQSLAVTAHVSGEGTRLNVEEMLRAMPDDAVVYVCGPARLIRAVVASARLLGLPADQVRFERFE